MADTDSKAKPSVEALKLAAASEEEVYATLGALLGTLEVIATDEFHPLDRVQVERLRSAGRLGRRINHFLEAMLILASEDLGDRLRRVRTPLRPLVEHALRGAIRSCAPYAVQQQLPRAEAWGDARVLVDASRIDRALGALVEALTVQVGQGGTIEVSAQLANGKAILQLAGRRGSAFVAHEQQALGFGEEISLLTSALLNRAWGRLFRLHGGDLTVDCEPPVVRIVLPALSGLEAT
jgi:hypothetical protein